MNKMSINRYNIMMINVIKIALYDNVFRRKVHKDSTGML